MKAKKKPARKAKPAKRKKLIGIGFGPKSNRQAIYVHDCDSKAHFMKERRLIKKYAYNPRDIHAKH